MLDFHMVYTCGYWSGSPECGLDDAQQQKLNLVCRNLNLKPGQTVLDILSFAKFAAENAGAKVVGITISKEQAALVRDLCKGLNAEIRFEDYRDTLGEFDHIVSLGMFEHVGPKNYRIYMERISGLLTNGGLFLLHIIGAT
ncbi:cyclopropane-fatty-acyl-phospholipid synthase [Lipomyces kononenkoae]|uniref:Cyclopropane-fatty-acyl-phospholipid synthase n=1 Tax=Lipomyces kononenkoae TaxID=34357 RepID=A0ACC3T0F9_LIPKO